MFTAATVCTSIHLKGLCITILFFGLCADMMQFSSVTANIIQFILKHLCFHVVMLSNLFCISTCFPLFMILQLNVTGYSIFPQIQEILLTAITAVCRHFLKDIPECSFMFFQNRDQCVIICPVIADISMDNEIILYCNLDIICSLSLSVQHVVLFHSHKGGF